MTTVEVFAPAKINLTLHVTGKREDGYHLIDSLVAFAPFGDRLIIVEGNTLSLTVEGPESTGVPADMNNLALKAAAIIGGGRGAALTLEKILPAASGIGGGSADAAAAWRGMLCIGAEGGKPVDFLWSAPDILLRTHAKALLDLGADVPMCLFSKSCRVGGIGEKITPVLLPEVPAVLVNPRVPLATREIFDRLERPENAAMPEVLPEFTDAGALIDWLGENRNDLQMPAMEATPEIGAVLGALRSLEGCELARMSGSGATCFGLFSNAAAARTAVDALRSAYPEWWVAGGLLGDQMKRALPIIS